jgi:Na+-driven multidrug efflux pump
MFLIISKIYLFLFRTHVILGNLLQQGYNIADTFIIGRTLGAKALAAVGSSYTLMVFITSIFIGLCMGCSALFSMRYGAKDYESLRRTQAASLLITGTSTLIIFAFSCYYIQDIITLMQTPGYDLRLPENHFHGNLVCLSL